MVMSRKMLCIFPILFVKILARNLAKGVMVSSAMVSIVISVILTVNTLIL